MINKKSYMNFVFFDTETTSIDHKYGQMIEFSAIHCDENLEIIEPPIELTCKLSPWVLPEPEALLVSGKTIEEINSSKDTHYEMIQKIMLKAKSWTPSLWIGWNSMGFDFDWLRSALYKSLHNTYFHQYHGNRRADALPIAKAIQVFDKGKIEVIEKKYHNGKRDSFRLVDMAYANGIIHEQAHNAYSDTLATLDLCKLMAKRSPEIWESSLLSSSKDDANRIMTNSLIFTYLEGSFGAPRSFLMTYLCYHPTYNYPMAIDLRIDPDEYLSLDSEALHSTLLNSPKLLRTIRSSKHPILLDKDYALKMEPYINIGEEEIMQRARKVKESTSLKERVVKILIEAADLRIKKRKNQNKAVEVEEEIHFDPKTISEQDAQLLLEFNSKDCWRTRSSLVSRFDNHRFNKLGLRLIHEHSPQLLDQETKEEIEMGIWKRHSSAKESDWNTFAKIEESIKGLRASALDEKDVLILESIERYTKARVLECPIS